MTIMVMNNMALATRTTERSGWLTDASETPEQILCIQLRAEVNRYVAKHRTEQ